MSSALDETWETTAKKLFADKAVGVMSLIDGKHTIFARVTGFVEDPTYGRLIQIQRVDEQGAPGPVEGSTFSTSQKGSGGMGETGEGV
jgi:hypothetical protein